MASRVFGSGHPSRVASSAGDPRLRRVMVSSGSNVSTFGVDLCAATRRCCASTMRFPGLPSRRTFGTGSHGGAAGDGLGGWFARIGPQSSKPLASGKALVARTPRETDRRPSVRCDSQAACRGARCGSGEVEDCMGWCSRSDHGDRSDTNVGDHSPRATETKRPMHRALLFGPNENTGRVRGSCEHRASSAAVEHGASYRRKAWGAARRGYGNRSKGLLFDGEAGAWQRS